MVCMSGGVSSNGLLLIVCWVPIDAHVQIRSFAIYSLDSVLCIRCTVHWPLDRHIYIAKNRSSMLANSLPSPWGVQSQRPLPS